MPGRDGTGPMGQGPATGRGLGFCTGASNAAYGCGLGLGCGRRAGFGRLRGTGFGRMAAQPFDASTQKDVLTQQRSLLQKQLESIDSQLSEL